MYLPPDCRLLIHPKYQLDQVQAQDLVVCSGAVPYPVLLMMKSTPVGQPEK